MRKIFFFCLLTLLSCALQAQFDISDIEKKPVIYGCEQYDASSKENFNCMQYEISRHIARNFRYPEGARQKNVQGKVYVNFVIDKNGDVTDVQVVRSAARKYWLKWWLKKYARLIDKESIRVVSMLEFKEPAYTKKDEAVNVMYTVPINALLQ